MVSVIMGVYNGEKTIKQAIDSIISQSYSDWEMIVCDDCSKDKSCEIAKEYSKNDNRIKVIVNDTNKGLASSLNQCLKYVHGEYIARMDCDDISVKDRLKKQVQFLDTHPELDICGTYMQSFDERGLHDIIPNKKSPTKYDLPKGAPFYHATIMIRTEALQSLNGYCVARHTERTEDVDLWYRFFAAGFSGENIEQPLYQVRIDEAAKKRRKLRYMLHASYIVWYGCKMLKLPFYYRIYCIKPILSWIMPQTIKNKLKNFLLH